MEYIKLAGVVIGANAFWKLVDSIIRLKSEKKLKSAESVNFLAQANKEVVSSFLQLSQELKIQVETQKERIDELEKSVDDERKRNDELEEQIVKLEQQNQELEEELNKLKNVKSSG